MLILTGLDWSGLALRYWQWRIAFSLFEHFQLLAQNDQSDYEFCGTYVMLLALNSRIGKQKHLNTGAIKFGEVLLDITQKFLGRIALIMSVSQLGTTFRFC